MTTDWKEYWIPAGSRRILLKRVKWKNYFKRLAHAEYCEKRRLARETYSCQQ